MCCISGEIKIERKGSIKLVTVCGGRWCFYVGSCSTVQSCPSLSGRAVRFQLEHSVLCWYRTHSIRSRVYVTVERPSVRPSVRLSHRSTAAAVARGFAAEHPAGRRHRSTTAAPAPRTTCRRVQQQRRRRSAANAGSVSLIAEERGCTQSRFSSLTLLFDPSGVERALCSKRLRYTAAFSIAAL